MSDIPSDVSREILRRVPVDSLFRLRSVCKSWCRIIDDPAFVKFHLRRSTGSDHLFLRNRTGKLYSLPFSSLDFSGSPIKMVEATNIRNLVGPRVSRICDLPVASCDGLILIPASKKTNLWLLWNPFTGESLELPLCNDFNAIKGGGVPASGLGYDATSDDYKAVRIAPCSEGNDIGLQTFIYSLNSNNWHKIEDFPDCVIWSNHGVFAFGALHWVTSEYLHYGVAWILSLDLSTERYRKLPLPSTITETRGCSFDVNAFGGCLFLSSNYRRDGSISTEKFDVWVIKGYGSEWINILSLKLRVTASKMFNFRLIACSESKELIVIQENNETFLWFDLKNKWSNRVHIKGIADQFHSQVIPASLIRLHRTDRADDGVDTEGVSKKKKRKRADRLEVKLEKSYIARWR